MTTNYIYRETFEQINPVSNGTGFVVLHTDCAAWRIQVSGWMSFEAPGDILLTVNGAKYASYSAVTTSNIQVFSLEIKSQLIPNPYVLITEPLTIRLQSLRLGRDLLEIPYGGNDRYFLSIVLVRGYFEPVKY